MKKAVSVLEIENLIGELIGAMVDWPQHAHIETAIELASKLMLIDVKVHASDVGKLIGKQGRNARALRTIAAAMGTKAGWRIELNLSSPKNGGER